MHMSSKKRATTALKSFGAAGLAVATIVSGLSFGPAAASAVPGTSSPGNQINAVSVTPPTNYGVRNADAGGFTTYGTPHCEGNFTRCLLTVHLSPNPSIPSLIGNDGTRYNYWNWAEGETKTLYFTSAAAQGMSDSVYSASRSIQVTRPLSKVALTAKVDSVDNIAKSAIVSGTATKGAKVSIGSQETTANNSNGSWSITVTGLKNGANELTAIQKINNTEIDRQTLTVNIQDLSTTLGFHGITAAPDAGTVFTNGTEGTVTWKSQPTTGNTGVDIKNGDSFSWALTLPKRYRANGLPAKDESATWKHEWTAADNSNGEQVVTLTITNVSGRTLTGQAAAQPDRSFKIKATAAPAADTTVTGLFTPPPSYSSSSPQGTATLKAATALTAKVDSVDNIAKTATVSGKATPGAKVSIGSQETTANASTGAWTLTVTGLKNGANSLTAIQKVNNTEIDRTTITATIVEGGTLVPIAQGPIDLTRDGTTKVPFVVQNNETRTGTKGTVVLTAPAGTTFPAQATAGGEWRVVGASDWSSSRAIPLTNGRLSNDNKTLTFDVDWPASHAEREQYRFMINVTTPANAAGGDSSMGFVFAGTSNKGAYRAEGSTSTKLSTALTAKVDSVDHIAKTATVSGKATPGAKVSIGSQETTANSSDGAWSITVTGLKNGANSLTAIQKINNTEIDRQTLTVNIQDLSTTLGFHGITAAPDAGTVFTNGTEGTVTWKSQPTTGNTGVDIKNGDSFSWALTLPKGYRANGLPAKDESATWKHEWTAADNSNGEQVITFRITNVSGKTLTGQAAAQPDRSFKIKATAAPAADTTITGLFTPPPSYSSSSPQGTATLKAATALTAKVDSVDSIAKTAVVSGTATKGAAISIGDESTTANAETGAWSLTVGGLEVGDNELVVIQKVNDREIDRVTVTATVEGRAELAPITLSGPASVTPGRSNTFTGKAEPGATYRVLNVSGNQIVPDIRDVDDQGNWTFDRVVSNGASNFRFVIEQTKNGQVAKSELFTINATALAPVKVLTPERVTPGRSNTFTGTGEPGATYRVLNISGSQIVPNIRNVDNAGNWTFDRVVSNGAPNFRFVIEQTKNGQIEKSELFTIDAAGLAPVTVDNRAVTPGVVNTFTGTGEPGATYRVLNISGTQIVPGIFEVDSEGEWRFDRAVSRGATEFRFALEQTKNGKTELSELFTLPADTK